MVDTGLMRKNEFKHTYNVFKKRYKLNVKLIDASKIYFKVLKNIYDPEKNEKLLVKYSLKSSKKRQKDIKISSILLKELYILM